MIADTTIAPTTTIFGNTLSGNNLNIINFFLALECNPDREFLNDAEANGMVGWPQREKYRIDVEV